MKRFIASTPPILAAALVAIISWSCYKPTPFVLPQQLSYQFPSAGEIASFLGTTNTNFKIVYALSENGPRFIYYVDFNDSVPVPKKLIKPAANASINTDKPLISPDSNGTFVTYGLLAPNNDIYGAYIQKLDTTAEPVLIAENGTRPHWYKDSTGSLYIVYSTLYMTPTPTMTNGLGVTYKQEVSLADTGSLVGSAVQIAPYPMIGGLSSDGSYLCTGYEAGCFYNLHSATLIPINEGVQICNPSIDPDPDTANRMMFLNYGGNTPQNLTNPLLPDSTYPADAQGVLPMHSVFFIVDASNTVKNFIPISIMGSGYAAWQCPQWSNKANFAAALAAPNEGSTSWDLVLIKNVGTKDGASSLILTIGSGKLNTNSTPSLWIGN